MADREAPSSWSAAPPASATRARRARAAGWPTVVGDPRPRSSTAASSRSASSTCAASRRSRRASPARRVRRRRLRRRHRPGRARSSRSTPPGGTCCSGSTSPAPSTSCAPPRRTWPTAPRSPRSPRSTPPRPVSGLAHYCASKAGVEALSRSAALELGPAASAATRPARALVRTPLMAPFLDRPEVSDAFTRGPRWRGSGPPRRRRRRRRSSSRRRALDHRRLASRSTAA